MSTTHGRGAWFTTMSTRRGRAPSASGVTRLAIDETAARRGQDYITLFVDIDQARVLFATEGNDAETVAAFADDLTEHSGDRETISEVCIDMSPAYIKGVGESLPKAEITFDRFHAVKIINDAVEKVRRARAEEPKLQAARHALHLATQSGQPVGTATGNAPGASNAPSQDRHVPTRSVWHSKTSPQPTICAGRSWFPEEMVFLGHSQQA